MNFRYFGKDIYGKEFEGIGCSHEEIKENGKLILNVLNGDENIEHTFRDILFWNREETDETPLPVLFS